MAAKKARKAPAPVLEPAECLTCKGTGEVSRTVRVGRKQRSVGRQTGICLACLGSGETATD
ncbi:hypothetical protein [Streptomyces chartreusis]|uniref:Molecular chaperone DnaJ n=1 Tax=Streptomyces chartreusis TaxID=1969 RepID=A0A7H8T8V0_STRCX|nr:hypothetical protein [Streptomyces chartreusis]QKZ19903.1 hypothetical protein HUT05_22580 [Streptomyces chartreusis]